MVTPRDPRPACPGWLRVPTAQIPPGHAGVSCGSRRLVIVARRGRREKPEWRLECWDCDRYFWTRTPGAAAYPGASMAQAFGWEQAAEAALAGFRVAAPLHRPARPYHDPAEPRTGGA